MTPEGIPPKLAAQLMLPELQQSSIQELQVLFIELSKKFTEMLDASKSIDELKGLQAHMQLINEELKRRQRPPD